MARPSETGSCPPGQAPAGLDASRIDPARIRFAPWDGPSDKKVSNALLVIAERDSAEIRRKATAQVQCAAFGCSPRSPISEPCGAWVPIGKATWVRDHYWVSAYGCTGGAYWNTAEGGFVCPECGYLNRAYGREEIEKLSKYFARSVTAYDHKIEGEYPYPPAVKARLVAEQAVAAAEKAQLHADRLLALANQEQSK